MKKYQFKIQNLDCANCATRLEEALQKLDIIINVHVNFMTQKLILECLEEEKEEVLHKMKKVIKKIEPEVIVEEEKNE